MFWWKDAMCLTDDVLIVMDYQSLYLCMDGVLNVMQGGNESRRWPMNFTLDKEMIDGWGIYTTILGS